MMYCENCQTMFVSPDLALDFTSEYFGRTTHHYLAVCPYCRSEEIRKANACPICGEVHEGEDEVCESCEEFVEEVIRKLKNKAIGKSLDWDEFADELTRRLQR